MVQVGSGWKSANFLPQKRQLFGLPGGLVNDWELKTNIEGLYAAGDQLFGSDCHGHAAATGYYAGRHASEYADKVEQKQVSGEAISEEKKRVYAPLRYEGNDVLGWKELNMGIAKIMQNYCGEIKNDQHLRIGLKLLQEIREKQLLRTGADNPHELVRTLEVFNILTVAEMIIHSCLGRKSNSEPLSFRRSDYTDSKQEDYFITVKLKNDRVKYGKLALDYQGPYQKHYREYNSDYIEKGCN